MLPKPGGVEQEKWLESLESVLEFALKNQGPEKTTRFLDKLTERLRKEGVEGPRLVSTPYINTIPEQEQVLYPGDREIELYVDVPGVDWKADPSLVGAPIRPLRL